MGVIGAVQYLLDPWLFMARSALFVPSTILRLLYRRQWSALVSWQRFRPAWFATFWRWAGPQVSNTGRATVVPLIQGRIRRGRVLGDDEKKKMAPPVSGTVVEVGPGSGMWVSVFAPAGAAGKGSKTGSSASKSASRQRKSSGSASVSGSITRIYGVEPNASVHDALRENVVAAGLDGVYEIVPTGIEGLAKTGKVAKGSVDCIVSVLCLCGIPDPQHNIRELYGYLKPGGRMYVYEHVCCTRHRIMIWYQRYLNLFWPFFMGGCQLLRDTGLYLREAGSWSSVDLAQPVDEPWYHPIPHIVGILTK